MTDPGHHPLGRASAKALLHYAVAALLIGPTLTLLLAGVYAPDVGVIFLGSMSMLAVGLMGGLLLQRERIDLAIHTLIYGVCLAATVIAVFTGGVQSPAIILYPALILMYGGLSQASAGIRLALLVTLLCVGLWLADAQDWLPAATHVPSAIHLVHAVLIFGLMAALMAFINRASWQQMRALNAVGRELSDYTQLLEKNARLLERAQCMAHMGSWVGDIAADKITPTPAGCRVLGLPVGSQLSFRRYLAQVHVDDRAAVKTSWRAALTQGLFDGEHRLIVNGNVQWVRQRAEIVFDSQHQPQSALGIVQDITPHKRTQMALKASEERYRTLIEWSPDAILVHRHTHIKYANPAALKLFGAPDLQSLLRKRTTDLIHPTCLESQRSRMMRIERGEPLPPTAEARFVKLDGTEIDVEVQGTAIEFDGEPAIHVSIRDITQHKQLENEIRQLAFYDTLTTLPNRRLLDDRLGQAITANRRSGQFGALMFLDLDNFKPLNDLHGHAVGDLLLVEAASRLKTCVREMDTVARFGGDEFVVLLAELDTDWQKAQRVAEQVAKKIKLALAKPYALPTPGRADCPQRIEHRCTSSIGVVVFASAHAHADELTKWADAAMYQAKNEGRNRICFSEHSDSEVLDNYFFDTHFPENIQG